MLKPEDILDFWFGPLDENGMPAQEKQAQWFSSSKQTDQWIRRRFHSYVTFASENGLPDWEGTPQGRLAMLLLLDQFSRNIYRGMALAFSNDRQALALCLSGLEKGMDVDLPLVQRAFFYMPLQHSERRKDQQLSVELFEQLHATGEGPVKEVLKGFLGYAREHREIIERFGRFPHRNAVLKRVSTPAETAYLNEGAPRYGQ